MEQPSFLELVMEYCDMGETEAREVIDNCRDELLEDLENGIIPFDIIGERLNINRGTLINKLIIPCLKSELTKI